MGFGCTCARVRQIKRNIVEAASCKPFLTAGNNQTTLFTFHFLFFFSFFTFMLEHLGFDIEDDLFGNVLAMVAYAFEFADH